MTEYENAPSQATEGESINDQSAPTEQVRPQSNGQAGQGHAAAPIDTLLEVLGAADCEFFAVCHEDKTTGQPFTSSVLPPGKVAGHIAGLSPTADVWFSVCPTAGPERRGGARGGKNLVTRMSAVFADLDLKDGACPDVKTAWAIVVEVSKLIGTYPAAAVYSGHGLHPYWLIEDGAIGDGFTNAQADALLGRFGRLVAAVAETFGVKVVDGVYNLDRILRVPGTTNNKNPRQPVAACRAPINHPGGPIDPVTLAERLDEAGIFAAPDDAEPVGADVLSDPDGWGFAEKTCHYAGPVIEGWRTDTPRKGRHPGYLMDRAVRLAAMFRLGCLDNDTANKAWQVVQTRFTELLATTEPRREPVRFEVRDAWRWARCHVSKMTDDQVRAQLGGHQHYGGVWIDPPESPVGDGQAGQASQDGATEVDEEAFWTAYTELTACRTWARAVRVGPWAMLGAALARASATIPPNVVLPDIVGDYASVNLYGMLPGESGKIKTAAIAAAGAWLRTAPTPASVKPGSGQGVARCFARIKNTRGESVQVGRRWTALAVIPEVDTLTAAGAMTGSSLWAELRSAWSDERVGHDYADTAKTVVMQPRRYRLCMIVGVQPLRSSPLFDDADAGTPQRFVWFPVDDPGAPDQRPERPDPLVLPRWPDTGEAGGSVEVFNFDIDEFRANMLHEPVDPDTLKVLDVPPEAREVIDAVAREKLRGNPDVDPLDGHQLLCRLKVAAALMRMCNRAGITSKDWELAGVVMAVSDLARQQVQAKLTAAGARRNLAVAKASGARKIIETQMATDAEVEKISKVAGVIVAALAKVDDRTLSGREVSRATGRDYHLVPRALDYLQIDGQVKVEKVVYRGQEGMKVTLLDEEEQTSG